MLQKRKIQGKERMRKLMTVWDCEIKAVVEVLTAWNKSRKVVILTDSQAVLAVIKNAGKTGKARTGELRKVIRKIEERKRAFELKAVTLGWVKFHVGIKDNKEADKKAKLEVDEKDPAF